MFNTINSYIQGLDISSISDDRKQELQILIDYIKQKKDKQLPINLNFICTHNSRRSQLAQVWAKVISFYKGVDINSYSGGVEITAFNQRAIESLKRSGFSINFDEQESNPKYNLYYAEKEMPVVAFSKLFDDPINEVENFAAVMTCSHADENCPFIPGTEKRIAVRYEDPKEFDNTNIEAEKYDERSKQIATELLYVFSLV